MSATAERARVLVVGQGAREHALGLALSSHTLFFAPGNAGTARIGTNCDAAADDVDAIVRLARDRAIDLVVIGPEAPLVLGLADALAAAGVRAFGPSKVAAELEGSKVFMKEFLARHSIPTAAFHAFNDAKIAKKYVHDASTVPVVKADGLCAGKGVVVASTKEEALAAIDSMMVDRVFGDAGARVVLEERLPGEEASFHVVTDGTRALALAAAQDHKRIHDGDRGPNTGGMGAYAPAPIVTPAVHARIMREIVEPTLRGMREEGAPFRGVLFVGLMIEDGVPRVLEFNVRFGDPETSVLVPTYDGDWFALLDGAARGELPREPSGTRAVAALSVVMAAEGYPGKVTTGDAIDGADLASADAIVLHAGTKIANGALVTAGGRVLCITGKGSSIAHARESAYAAVSKIHWRGEQHRNDIGHRALDPTNKPREA